MHKVAITGVGVVSVLGIGTDAVSLSLREGRSGIGVDPERTARGFISSLAGRIPAFTSSPGLPRKQRKSMTEFTVWAHAAVMEALEMSGLDQRDLQNDMTGIIFGSDSSCLAQIEQTRLARERGDTSGIGSRLVFQTMTSNITQNLGVILGAKGANWTLSAACASGGHAVGQAADMIALGRQERIICGGAQEINWESLCSFDAIGAFSRSVEDPTKASRPFDAERDGLVPSGGAAALILERYDMALKRGAKILGEIAGYGFSSDGYSLTVPSGDGLSRAMRMALKNAASSPKDIDYVCAHATSTPAGDVIEARNIAAVFTDHAPPVSSLKSMTGHELWMTGASQAVYCTIMARDGFIAPNINYNKPDPSAPYLNIVVETIERMPRTVICNAAGFGGTNSCLVLRFSQ